MTPREEFALKAKGYTLHDGGPRPREVTANSRPGVVLDDGTVIVRGTTEAERIDWARVRGWKELDRSTVPSGLAFSARKLR